MLFKKKRKAVNRLLSPTGQTISHRSTISHNLNNELSFFVLIPLMSFYPYHYSNNKMAKKAKVYLTNQFKDEQKSSTMSSPTRTAERKMERKIIQ